MIVTVNGRQRDVAPGSTVAALVEELGLAGARGVAVACNAAVVARSLWATTLLRAGDAVEVLHAVQGGC